MAHGFSFEKWIGLDCLVCFPCADAAWGVWGWRLLSSVMLCTVGVVLTVAQLLARRAGESSAALSRPSRSTSLSAMSPRCCRPIAGPVARGLSSCAAADHLRQEVVKLRCAARSRSLPLASPLGRACARAQMWLGRQVTELVAPEAASILQHKSTCSVG